MISRLFFALMYLRKPIWDTGISPPELMEHIQSHPAGKALDLGCGTGTNVITLARNGWQATGVDFQPKAIRQAQEKARQAGLTADFHLDDVTRLKGISGPFDLILDLGCFHSLPHSMRLVYIRNLDRLLAPGGTFLLYAFVSLNQKPGIPYLTEGEISAVSDRLHLEKRVDSLWHGRTTTWFTWKRPEDS